MIAYDTPHSARPKTNRLKSVQETNVTRPTVYNKAQVIRTERASNLSIKGPVVMVKTPQTKKVTPLRIAISLLEICKSSWITKIAGGMIPESAFSKKLAARNESRRIVLVLRGTSSRSIASERLTDPEN